MTPPRVRLAFSKFLWRATLTLFVVFELTVLSVLLRRILPRRAFAVMLFQTPGLMFAAFLVAGVMTVGADLAVRFVIRPLVDRWVRPPSEESAGSFHMDARERVLMSSPARRWAGWLWPTGRLVVTDRRVWFFPTAWDAEPWSHPVGGVSAAVVPAPEMLLGLVTDLPARLRLGLARDRAETFALADPGPIAASIHAAARSTAAPRTRPAGIETTE